MGWRRRIARAESDRTDANAIKSQPWDGDEGDAELRLLPLYLPTINDVPNVRSIDTRWWREKVAAGHRLTDRRRS